MLTLDGIGGGGVAATAVVCTNNVVSGYYFNAAESTTAGTNATTTTCPSGTAGYATRRCLWNGPSSQYGVWADPTSYCVGKAPDPRVLHRPILDVTWMHCRVLGTRQP